MIEMPKHKFIESEVEKTDKPSISKHRSEVWHRLCEVSLVALLGEIPHPIGSRLRGLMYPVMFSRLGRGNYIQTGCEFLGSHRIEIGTTVKILRDVRLNAAPNSLLRIGDRVCLDRGVDINTVNKDCLIEIGEGSYLGPYICMAGPGYIKIGKNCMIASQSGLYANNHRADGMSAEGIEIGDNCWLGTGVKVLDGVKIGHGCVIGAGAVVTKNIPPRSLAVGVPAKVIKATKAEGRC